VPRRATLARPTPGRWRRSLVRVLAIALVIAIGWIIGLVAFVARIPSPAEVSEEPADAAVVLTGGGGRLETGLALLERQQAKKLFVSGVHEAVDVDTLLASLPAGEVSPPDAATIACCIRLGHNAADTKENAEETAAWIRAEGFASLRLVTADYHMPRSLLEFHRAMPEIRILPYPVFPEQLRREGWWRWPGTTSLLIREYNKYLVALARGIALPSESASAP
jgi:uncharacterized SAM-binding protein YcdF (DUF218 family)